MERNRTAGVTNVLFSGLLMILLAALLSFALPPSLAAAEITATSTDVITVTLDDGDYLMPVTLEGGSGRASITSPTLVSISEGKAMATIEWSSPNYDYMIVAGTRYPPTNTGGNSVFLIPMMAIDEPFEVIADTTAMSQPHEITYQLTFDSTGALPTESATKTGQQAAWIVPIVLATLAVVGFVTLRLKRLRKSATQS